MNKNINFVILLLFIFAFVSTSVFAKENKIKIIDAKIVDKSYTVIADNPVSSDENVSLNAKFNQKDDFVIYELTIKNSDDLKWKIKNITDNNELKNLKIEYSYEDDYIENNGTSKVKIKLIYIDKLINTESININNIAITINLLSENGNDSNIIINNPITHDGILKYFVLLIVSICALICKKTKKRFKKLKVGNFLILIAIIMSPFMIFAEEKISLNVNIQNIILESEMLPYKVEFNSNGGKDVGSIIVNYGSTVGELPTTFKYGYEFDGWYKDLDFTVKIASDTVITNNITLYAKWNKIPFTTVFSHEGPCTFNGKDGVITGDECRYSGEKYINTGVSLYSDENYSKDYEIYFEIDEYDPNNQDPGDQMTFLSTKYETLDEEVVPGVTVRRDSDSVEITEAVNQVVRKASISASNLKSVKIARINGKTYYSFNGNSLSELYSLTDTSETFDLPAVFGAAITRDGIPFREIKATLSNMYIKFGKYPDENLHTITFNPNGGTINFSEKLLNENEKIGPLPSANLLNNYLDGWYTDIDGGEKISSNMIPNNNVTYYAHWKKSLEGAIIESYKLIFNIGTTKKINILNSNEIEEEYLFVSDDPSIASVDDNGNVLGVSVGETTITIKGKKSRKTKIVEIKINDGKSVVTLDTNGGKTLDEIIVDTDSQIGELPIPLKIGYKFDGWYTDSNYIEKVTSTTIVSEDVTYYAKWTKKELTTVFSHDGSCTFNGQDGVLTGEECIYANGTNKYIDTGISLYNSTNYTKDYEISFEIDEYDSSNQDSGSNQVFVNSKLENSSIGYPGLVFRRNAYKKLEVSQTISNNKKNKEFNDEVSKVVILRDNNVIYYSINDSLFEELQDMSNLVQPFDTTVWFGAAPDSKGNPFRYIKATISNMKIKIGD